MKKSKGGNVIKMQGHIRIYNQEVVHTNHSLQRWNSGRLNEYHDFKSIEDANDYIQGKVSSGNIKHIYKDFYLIDDDIVAVLDVTSETIKVVTYYGSRSQNPALWNISTYIRNAKKYGRMYLGEAC